jgi:predicted TIM-barrel fold metal-dependent hydrolase
MTIDALAYLGQSRFGYSQTADELLASMEREDITTTVVAAVHRRDHDVPRANADVARACADSDGRLLALARLDPWEADPLTHLEEAIAQGVCGIFLHPLEELFRINAPSVRPIAERAVELGLPIVVATGYQGFSEPVQITQFAQWCSGTPVLLTNGGQFNISGLAQMDAGLALSLDNVYVHTSGVYRDDWISLVVSTYGAERIMFASASPTMSTPYEVRRVTLAHVPDEAKALMLSGNAERIFGIDVGRA